MGGFDRFAGAAIKIVSRAPFVCACVLLVLVWFPTLFIFAVTTSQLIIHTITTIITFLLVALLQNSQTRSDDALQQKLNAIADALADLMASQTADDKTSLADDIKDLRSTVGLEDRESA